VAQAVAAEFPAHEREHVRVLSSELERRGGTPPAPPARQPASPSNSPDAVRHLISLETLAEAAYYGSMARLSDPGLMRLAAELMCCEAQHWSALSELLHSGDVYSAVPTATITGG
jgi:Ferritin-like domain